MTNSLFVSRANYMLPAQPITENRITIAGHRWSIVSVEDQDTLMRQVHTEDDLANFPYGLMLWHSAIGLSERLATEPALIRSQRVLEIGAGVGLCGLVAQWLGATVTQTEYHADALALARHNADRNGVTEIEITRGDWRDFPHHAPYPVVIGSDVLYERDLHDTLLRLFARIVAPGGLLILSDPLRPQAVDLMERLEYGGRWEITMESRTVQWNNIEKEIALFFARYAV